ncbi:MAG TPA: inorganic diphosphatase [Clostridiaceae bacterium]|nr:inorganic diphosphatase [Clostridiaceae bacterium]
MNPWNNLPKERILPDDFLAVIEIPKGSKQKYEVDNQTGLLRLDRILYTSTHYPQNYGFIPQTTSDDGDPLDVLVLCSESLTPLCMVRCYPIGAIKMTDDDHIDEKIIAVPFDDPQMSYYQNLTDLPDHVYNEIMHFFEVYKDLENIKTDILQIDGREVANEIIANCRVAYEKSLPNKKDNE